MHEERGFSLVEVIVAMMLLGVVVIALLPGLWLGVQNAARQSTTATAERFLNSLVEEARETPTCAAIPTVIGRTTTDGKGSTLTSAGTVSTGCASGSAVTLTLSVTNDGRTLASTVARIYVP